MEQLASESTWTLKLDGTGLVTVTSPSNVLFTYLFTELVGDVTAVKIGFRDFDTTVSNCYRVYNPNQMDNLGEYVLCAVYVCVHEINCVACVAWFTLIQFKDIIIKVQHAAVVFAVMVKGIKN